MSKKIMLCLFASFVLAACDEEGAASNQDMTPLPALDMGEQTLAGIPTKRSAHASVLGKDGRIYVIGGYNSSLLTSVDVYDPATNTWKTTAPLPSERFALAASAAPDGRILVFGGRDSYGGEAPHDLDEVLAYDPVANKWTEVETKMPTTRAYAAYTTDAQGRTVLLGGCAIDQSDTKLVQGFAGVTKRVDVYDATTNEWSRLADLPHETMFLAATTTPNGTIYYAGGVDSTPQITNDFLYRYDATNDAWTQGAALTLPRYLHSLASDADGRLYAIAGIIGVGTPHPYTGTVDVYDPMTQEWSGGAGLEYERSESTATRGNDSRIYVIGGGDLLARRAANVIAYSPAAGAWTKELEPN